MGNMSTLEAIQYLLDNPGEMIRENGNENNPNSFVKNYNGAIVSCDSKGVYHYTFLLTATKMQAHWQVVTKPPKQVTWQEAIQAWIDGKNIYVDLHDLKRHYPGANHYFHDLNEEETHRDELRKGKWYIEN